MIKAADNRVATPREHAASYEESAQPPLGLIFCRKDGAQRLAVYSFLSAVDFDGKGEITFQFTTWKAIVRGERLEPLWQSIQDARLSKVRESEHAIKPNEPWVRKITFAALGAEAALPGPAFPEDRARSLRS
jgi:hypothetical protein